jgi:hypothetical protein
MRCLGKAGEPWKFEVPTRRGTRFYLSAARSRSESATKDQGEAGSSMKLPFDVKRSSIRHMFDRVKKGCLTGF